MMQPYPFGPAVYLRSFLFFSGWTWILHCLTLLIGGQGLLHFG